MIASGQSLLGGETLFSCEITAQLQEALVMAGMVSLRNNLSVELGASWAFDWRKNAITVPLEALKFTPPAALSWTLLHEAAHAALSRLHDILPASWQARPEVNFLLDCIEDVRINIWLKERYPGSRAWCTAAECHRSQRASGGDHVGHPVHSFLRGIRELGETGTYSDAYDAVVRAALEEVRPGLAAAIQCIPPAVAVAAPPVEALYQRDAVSRCYALVDGRQEPSVFEKWVRIMQGTMWRHVLGGVWPVYLRLVREFGVVCPPLTPVEVVRSAVINPQPFEQRDLSGFELTTRAVRALFNFDPGGRYSKAVLQFAAQIQATTELFLQLLPNHRGLGQIRGCRSGDRLDMRVAAQLQANPRLHEKLWIRRRRKTLPEPAFVFLVDRSDSMLDRQKSEAAFDSMVLLRETCLRLGIPFSLLVFNNEAEVLHDWDQSADAFSEAALGAILKPEGGTDLRVALVAAREQLRSRFERDRILVLISDGLVASDAETVVRAEIFELRRVGVRILALGLGDETRGMPSLFAGALILNDASNLPEVLAETLAAALRV